MPLTPPPSQTRSKLCEKSGSAAAAADTGRGSHPGPPPATPSIDNTPFERYLSINARAAPGNDRAHRSPRAAGGRPPGQARADRAAPPRGPADRDRGRRADRREPGQLLVPSPPAGEVRAGRGGRRRPRARTALARDGALDAVGERP